MIRRSGFVITISSVAMFGLAAATMVRAGGPAREQAERSLPSNAERLVEMQHHFTQVARIQEAVTRGDLAAVRQPALELANLAVPPEVPASAVPFVVATRLAGQRAADATTIGGAAAAVATMITQCGDCHQAVNVRPSPSTTPRPDVGGLVGHMLDHQRATDELLKGLLIPSDSEWHNGAERLRVAAMKPSELPPDPKLGREVEQAEQHVHELAAEALRATTQNERSTTYAHLLSTCAECHSLHRRIWGPGRGV
jgi:mono/diheme cytochrome c family protein